MSQDQGNDSGFLYTGLSFNQSTGAVSVIMISNSSILLMSSFVTCRMLVILRKVAVLISRISGEYVRRSNIKFERKNVMKRRTWNDVRFIDVLLTFFFLLGFTLSNYSNAYAK